MPATLAPIRTPPLDEYSVEHDVPIFTEHTIEVEGDSGEKESDCYGLKELQYITDNLNNRIEDTGDFVPIVVGHTDPEDKSVKPPVVGFAGPYKIGRFGRTKPRWAIFAENWWTRKDPATVELIKQHPRRSVELWREDRYEDRFFDPISLLGADTPRLDLGLMFSRTSGKKIRRYSAVAPSGTNTFAPTFGDEKKKLNYAGPEPDDISSEEGDMPSVDEIVQALEQTDVFQWARGKMAEESGVGGDADDAAPPEAPPAAPPPANPPPGDQENMNMPYARTGDKDRYARLERELRETKDLYAKTDRENKALKDRLDAKDQETTRAVRYARLQELSMQHVLDPEEEIEEVLAMDDKTWDKHQDRILNRYERIPAGRVLPYERPAMLKSEAADSAAEKEIAEEAANLVTSKRNAGEKITYSAARELVVQQRKQKRA